MLSSQIGRFLEDDGVYIVSGIIDTREAEVVEALSACGFKTVKRNEDGGWLCFECKKQ